MRQSKTRILCFILLFVSMMMQVSTPISAQSLLGNAQVHRLEWTRHLAEEGEDSFTLDAVHIEKGESQQAMGFLTAQLNGKMIGLHPLALPDAAGMYRIGDIAWTLQGDPQLYKIKVILLQNLQGLLPMNRMYQLGERSAPEIVTIAPDQGSFGTSVLLTGQGFASTPERNIVRFIQADGTKLSASVVSVGSNYLEVLAPVLNAGIHQVEVEVEGRISNQKSFNAEALPAAQGNETRQLMQVTQSLLTTAEEVSDTLQVASLPLALQSQMVQLLGEAEQQMNHAQTELMQYSPEAQELINRMLQSSGVPEQIAPLDKDPVGLLAETGQDYTIGDRLEKVDQITNDVRNARDKIRSLDRNLKIMEASLTVGGIAGLVFGGSGSGAIALAAEIESFRQAIIQPILLSLRAIYTVLSCSTSSAVAGSLRFEYVDDVHIEQYFGHAQEPALPEWQNESLLSSLSNVFVGIEELQYLHDDVLHLLQQPYGSTSETMPEGFSTDMLRALQQISLYEDNWRRLTQQADQTFLPGETLRNNAGEIEVLMKQYRRIVNQIRSAGDKMLQDLMYAQINPQMSFDHDWYQSMKYAIGDLLREANSLNSVLNALISDFHEPEQLNFEEESPAYGGYIDTPGILLAGQSYIARGNMDFNVGLDETRGLDNMLDGIGTSFIVDLVGGLVDLELELEDVNVRLSAVSSDESVLRTEWSDSIGLRLIPLKPGLVTVTIVPNIRLVREGKIKAEYISVSKPFRVISANQIAEEYSVNAPLGPNLEHVTDEAGLETRQVYLGETLHVQGLGFASSSQYMNVYTAGVPGIHIDGLLPDFLYNGVGSEQQRREELCMEVPDTLSGQLRVAVHLKQAMEGGAPIDRSAGLSNGIDLQVLAPVIDFMPPNLIDGESYPVLGRGFSHTPWMNKIIFDDFEATNPQSQSQYYAIVEPSLEEPFTQPKEYNEVTAENHPLLHVLHERLTFLADGQTSSSLNNRIKVLEQEDMSDIAGGSLVQSWGSEIVFSQNGITSMRPLLAEDETSGLRMAAWVALNERGAAQWIAAEINANGNMATPQHIASNLGSMETAPDKGCLVAYRNRFYFVYTGRDGELDRLYCSIYDGGSWSIPVPLTGGMSSALKPVAWVGDWQDDNQAELFLAYIADDGMVGQTITAWYTLPSSGAQLLDQVVLSANSISRPALTKHENGFYVAYQGIHLRQSDLYLCHVQISANSTSLLPAASLRLSRNSGEAQAENPSIVIGRHPVSAAEQVVVVWENSAPASGTMNQREEVYLATVTGGVVNEPVNLTHSEGHSQSPTLALGKDGSIALLFLEITPAGISENQTLGYTSQVWFTRSFDGGTDFQRPYYPLTSRIQGVRLGHPALLNRGDGKVNMTWQAGDQLFWRSSGETIIPPSEYPANLLTPRKQTFGYSNDETGVRLLNGAGEPLRRITTATGWMQAYPSEMLRLAVSPSGRYVALPGYWLQISEADGSHPLDIALPHDIEEEMPKHIAWGLDEQELRVSYVEFGINNAQPLGTWQREAVEGEVARSYGFSWDRQERYILQREWLDSIPTLHRDFYVVDSVSGEERYVTSLPNRLLAISPDGTAVLLHDSQGAGRNRDGLVLRQLGGASVVLYEGIPEAAAFSFNGRYIAAVMRQTGQQAVLKVWDLHSGTCWDLALLVDNIERLSFSPDNNRVFWQTTQATWHTQTAGGDSQVAKTFIQNFVTVGQASETMHVSAAASVWKNRAGSEIGVTLRQTPTADVTVQVVVPIGLVALPQSVSFAAGEAPVVRKISIYAQNSMVAGLNTIALRLHSEDLRFEGVEQHVSVITSEAVPFTSGLGYSTADYGEDSVYPILHNWNRQVPIAAAGWEQPLWQANPNFNDVKVLQAGNGVTLMYGRDYMYHVQAYSKTGQSLWETDGKSPLLQGEDAVFLRGDNMLIRKNLLTGEEYPLILYRADGTEWRFWSSDLFYADTQGNMYALAQRMWGETFLHVLRIEPNGRVSDHLIDEAQYWQGDIPVVTQDGKLLVAHNHTIDVMRLDDFSVEQTLYGVDHLLSAAMLDFVSPQYSIFYVMNGQGASTLLTAMSTKNASPLWQRVLAGTWNQVGQPVLHPQGMMMLPVGSSMLALGSQDGKVLWQQDFEEEISGAPVLDARGDIYVTVGDDLLRLSGEGVLLQRKSFGVGGRFAVNTCIGHEGQVIFGGGMTADQTRYPIFAWGVTMEEPLVSDVVLADSLLRVREDEGELRVRLLDRSSGEKGGFEVEVQLLPLTAIQGTDYQLNYKNSTGRVTFAEGAEEAWLYIDIFDGYDVQSSRDFVVKIVGVTGGKTFASNVTTVQVEDVSVAPEQRSRVGWGAGELLYKEGESGNMVLKRSPNSIGTLPELNVRVQVGSPGSYFAYTEALQGVDYSAQWAPDSAGRVTVLFAEGQSEVIIPWLALTREGMQGLRKWDVRVLINSAVDPDFSMPQTYVSELKLYVAEGDFVVPEPRIKQVGEAEWKVSNILYGGWFKVESSDGTVLQHTNGYLQSLDGEYSVYDLPAGNPLILRSGFANQSTTLTFNTP